MRWIEKVCSLLRQVLHQMHHLLLGVCVMLMLGWSVTSHARHAEALATAQDMLDEQSMLNLALQMPTYYYTLDFLYFLDEDDDSLDDNDDDHVEHDFYVLRRDPPAEFEAAPRLRGLEKVARDHLAQVRERIVHFSYRDKSYVAKRIIPKSRSWLKQFAVSALCSRAFPGHMQAVHLAPADGLYEAGRIQALGKAGEHVPKVALIMNHAVIYSDCGQDLRSYLKRLDHEEQKALLHRAAADLARFHHAGHWHGGAQLRNWLIHEDGHFYRVDFEESLGSALSLPLAQMYDLCQFLADATRYAVPAYQAPMLVNQLLQTYKSGYWTDAHQHLLGRVQRVLTPLQRILNLMDNWRMKDVMRIKWLLRGLQS
jgi:tRNA A-37 threonylcarbamoyl transferase component Bud32